MGFGELSGLLVEERAVGAPLLCDLHLEWVVSVWSFEERNQGFDEVLGVLRGHPIVLDGLSANLPGVLLDVGVVDLGQELDLGAFERVLVSEVHVYVEVAALIWCVFLVES